jgi:hypothetical protein
MPLQKKIKYHAHHIQTPSTDFPACRPNSKHHQLLPTLRPTYPHHHRPLSINSLAHLTRETLTLLPILSILFTSPCLIQRVPKTLPMQFTHFHNQTEEPIKVFKDL